MNTPRKNNSPLSQKKKLGEYLVRGGLIDEVFRAAPPESKSTRSTPHPEAPREGESEGEGGAKETYFSEPSAAVSSATPKRILVVDDSAVVRKAVSHQLEAEGYLVMTANDGLEALKTASKEKPDLILLDYLMPKMDGLAVMKKLKSQLATRFIPIIMLTAKDEIDSEVEAIEAGADDYLTKPFSPKRLKARIDRLLRK